MARLGVGGLEPNELAGFQANSAELMGQLIDRALYTDDLIELIELDLLTDQMSRVCQLTGTRANNGMAVSHSHIRTKKLQQANLQHRKLWWAEGNKWVNIRITTRALKTIQKKGLGPYAKSLGVDLNKI